MGSGVGEQFGPKCSKGDIMGCGVLFPRDFECKSDSDEEGELVARLIEDQVCSSKNQSKIKLSWALLWETFCLLVKNYIFGPMTIDYNPMAMVIIKYLI